MFFIMENVCDICYAFFASVARCCWASIQRLRVVWSVYVLYKGSCLHLISQVLFKYGFQLAVKPGGVLDVSLGGEVRHGPSYPDPV